MGQRPQMALWLIWLTALTGCLTPEPPPPAKAESCYCGRPSNSAKTCAVWSKVPPLSSPNPILASKLSQTCDLNFCRGQFQKVCADIRLWPYPEVASTWERQEECYCDQLWLDINGEPALVCAAWSAQKPWLIEYYQTDNCEPQACGQAPFVQANSICPNGFKAFYQPWGTSVTHDNLQQTQP